MRRGHGQKKYGYWLEQGLGKTALFLNDYVDQFAGDNNTIVAVCPNSFKMDWTLAPAEWGLDFTTSMWPKQEFKFGTDSKPHLNVINFESARAAGYDIIRDMFKKRRCTFLVDESSAIKNFQSQTARAIVDLSKYADSNRLLNGTPLTQNVMDLFPQLKCLGELDKMNPYVFRNRFAQMGGFMGRQITGIKNEGELQEIQSRVSFRALKEDWSDLPEKVQVPLRLEMTDNQRRHYKEMYQDFYTMVQGQEFDAQMVLTQMDKLRQITSGLLIDGDNHVLIDPPSKNPKIKAALDILEVGAGKMIIVHFYSHMGRVIYDEMEKKGFNPAYIRGGMKPEAIICEKHKFNNDPSCRVIVCQIQASSKSHTLLGGTGRDRCHLTFYHDFTFSLLDKSQMDDRNHRGAQDHAVSYFNPIMSPIDEVQIKALATKQGLADLVVNSIRAMPNL